MCIYIKTVYDMLTKITPKTKQILIPEDSEEVKQHLKNPRPHLT